MPPADRSRSIDALRGLALLGIALVNVPWIGFRHSLGALLFDDARRSALPIHDLAAALFVEGLCEGRFYPIFGALFGVGMGIVLAKDGAVHARRMLALLIFGVLHASFGWWGDILTNYALVGLAVWPLWRLRPRALVAIALGFVVAATLASMQWDDWMGPQSAERAAELEAYAAREAAIYGRGSFADISAHRARELLSYFATWQISYRLNVFACVIAGLAIERAGLRARVADRSLAIGRIAVASLCAGVVIAPLSALWTPLYVIGGDVLGAGYALGVLWLVERGKLAAAVGPLVAVGRVALSAYLLQTLAFTLFFYGYGLGMYGRIGPAAGVALAGAVFAIETALAVVWLSRFERGPMEALWRRVAYRRK